MCTTADGLGEVQAPKKASTRTGSGTRQASECCIQSVQMSPGLFSQKKLPEMVVLLKDQGITLDPPGQGRQLQRAIQEACLSPDTQTGCYPPFPVRWGPALPIRLPVSPSPGRKEAVTYGSRPGGPREGSLRRGSPAGQQQAAPRLHLPSELSSGCGPALGCGL